MRKREREEKIREGKNQMKLPVLRRLGGWSTLLQEWGVTQPKDHNTIYTRESVCVSTYPRYSHHGRGKESREI